MFDELRLLPGTGHSAGLHEGEKGKAADKNAKGG
jgi:hypothetical protein